MKFTEAQLEAAIIEHLGVEGYPHVLGESLGERSSSCVASTKDKDGAGAPSLPGVLIKDDLRHFLGKQYADEGITEGEVEKIILQLEDYSAADLYESNKAIMKLVCDGFLLKRDDHTQKRRPPRSDGSSLPTTTSNNNLPGWTSLRSSTGLHLNNHCNLSKVRDHFSINHALHSTWPLVKTTRNVSDVLTSFLKKA